MCWLLTRAIDWYRGWRMTWCNDRYRRRGRLLNTRMIVTWCDDCGELLAVDEEKEEADA